MFHDNLKDVVKREFFPFVSIDAIQEKLLTNGYKITSVKKKFGVITFHAQSDDSFFKNLIFGINETTKKMTIFVFVAEKNIKEKIKMFYVTNIENDLFNKIEKTFSFKGFKERLHLYLNQEENFLSNDNLFVSEEFQNPLYFMFISSFKGRNMFISHRIDKLVASSIQRVLINALSENMPELITISTSKKEKLKKVIINKILQMMFISEKASIQRLELIMIKGNSILGLNCYQSIFEQYKYDINQYNNFFDEIKFNFYELVYNELIEQIQTVDENNIDAINKVYLKYSSSNYSYIPAAIKYKYLRTNAFYICFILTAIEEKNLHHLIFGNIPFHDRNYKNSEEYRLMQLFRKIKHKENCFSSPFDKVISVNAFETLKSLYLS